MESASGGIQPNRPAPAGSPVLRVLQEESWRSSITPPTPSEPRNPPASLWQEARAIPNLLTYLRILAIPVFLWAYVRGDARLALVLFVGAALTDGLDGLLARVLHQKTRLGGVLDPVADKFLTLAAAVALVWSGQLPFWLLGIVLLRDACITLAVAVLKAYRKPLPDGPTRFGKYATFALAATLTLALIHEASSDPAWGGYVAAAALLSLQCVAITIVQYFLQWRRLMQAPLP